MGIQENLTDLLQQLPSGVKLVAVSKTKPVEIIKEALQTGHSIFGENKVQELIAKQEQLPVEIEWHYIGHLQRNKVKFIAPFVALIHAVDSIKLLGEINKQAIKNNRIIDCLLQFHIAEESTKFGLDFDEAIELIESEAYKSFNNVRITGVMGMATYTDRTEQVRNEFRRLKDYFDQLKKIYFSDTVYFKEISMGMSDDYQIAIEEGSTLIRVGTRIFGER
ncbi:MAG: YggS family pyridoxal phosphate-dependent enzyme [Marinilabiliales bacterium]|jgi:pyridoxal phosphate enzyme (YggS family)|nr:MAG: YggS family pyridoxal phosphate-dependent enzyme [Marinilabiliales bacterium]